ncbi:unnamed protein product [Effrenium voratum]|uniref:Uncharacterized protein n=1 Tax=Effrenium voratum TaxID=2562239 RepID=A0AA36N7Z0_9DINO|nr:unnamed protein product [Effrenium voratum]CAJ1433859.1 unnamed protein product [Effrenium voratum]
MLALTITLPLTCPIDLVYSRAFQQTCPRAGISCEFRRHLHLYGGPQHQRNGHSAWPGNSAITIPNVEHTCMGFTAESTCFALLSRRPHQHSGASAALNQSTTFRKPTPLWDLEVASFEQSLRAWRTKASSIEVR